MILNKTLLILSLALIITASPVVSYFEKYVKMDTQSDPASKTVPTTSSQWDILKVIKSDLEFLGVSDITLSDKAVLIATIPAINSDKTVAFISHVDTAPDASGDVKEVLRHKITEDHLNYGLWLNDKAQIKPHELVPYLHRTILTSDGSSLLGVDDKNAVAGAVASVPVFLAMKQRPKIMLIFTPDEEVGRSVNNLPIEELGIDYMWSFDAQERGSYNIECFNAAEAWVTISGHSKHTGHAYKAPRMENALTTANMLVTDLFSKYKDPSESSGRQGFVHLQSFEGNPSETKLLIRIRSFEKDEYEAMKSDLRKIAENLQQTYDFTKIDLEIDDIYINIRDQVDDEMVQITRNAMSRSGWEPQEELLRGGADCAFLAARGQKCINLATAGRNFHSVTEFTSIEDLEEIVVVMEHLVKLTI